MLIITGAAGFIGSNILHGLNRRNYKDIVLVDDFSKSGKENNYGDKTFTSKVERSEFIDWIGENHRFIQFIFHLGARTDTTEFDQSVFDELNLGYSKKVWERCVEFGIPFVTGAAVGVSGQAFTVLPKQSACYFCMFPELNEDTMPTCSIEGVHPSILSIVGGIEVAEAVKIVTGKKPSLSERILHIDLENLDFNSTKTFRAEECPICGTGKLEVTPKEELILEELCGRNRGKRTYSITPTKTFDLNVNKVTTTATEKGFKVENQGSPGQP